MSWFQKLKAWLGYKKAQYKAAGELGYAVGRSMGKEYWNKVDEVEQKIGVDKVDEWLARKNTKKP